MPDLTAPVNDADLDTPSTDVPPPPTDADPSQTTDDATPEKRVPVTEAIRYRKRAQSAEQQLGELHDRFGQLQRQLDESRQTIVALERRQKIDALLTDSDAIDLEAARLLTEVSVSQMDEPDVDAAVSELRRQKPYLFRRRSPRSGSAMAPRVETPAEEELAAERAAASGDRRDLLDYLRLRRR
ncbi:MAG: hypothetical protein AAFX76_02125 [Planctomycetota bacterium]